MENKKMLDHRTKMLYFFGSGKINFSKFLKCYTIAHFCYTENAQEILNYLIKF